MCGRSPRIFCVYSESRCGRDGTGPFASRGLTPITSLQVLDSDAHAAVESAMQSVLQELKVLVVQSSSLGRMLLGSLESVKSKLIRNGLSASWDKNIC